MVDALSDEIMNCGDYASAFTETRTGGRLRDDEPDIIPPAPLNWRNTGWLKKNPRFEVKTLSTLPARVELSL